MYTKNCFLCNKGISQYWLIWILIYLKLYNQCFIGGGCMLTSLQEEGQLQWFGERSSDNSDEDAVQCNKKKKLTLPSPPSVPKFTSRCQGLFLCSSLLLVNYYEVCMYYCGTLYFSPIWIIIISLLSSNLSY